MTRTGFIIFAFVATILTIVEQPKAHAQDISDQALKICLKIVSTVAGAKEAKIVYGNGHVEVKGSGQIEVYEGNKLIDSKNVNYNNAQDCVERFIILLTSSARGIGGNNIILSENDSVLCVNGGSVAGIHQNGTEETFKVPVGATVFIPNSHAAVAGVKYHRVRINNVGVRNPSTLVGFRAGSISLLCN